MYDSQLNDHFDWSNILIGHFRSDTLNVNFNHTFERCIVYMQAVSKWQSGNKSKKNKKKQFVHILN